MVYGRASGVEAAEGNGHVHLVSLRKVIVLTISGGCCTVWELSERADWLAGDVVLFGSCRRELIGVFRSIIHSRGALCLCIVLSLRAAYFT